MPVIETHELTKQFDDSIAVDRVNLTVNAGEIYGLIGPNGAGKTTLIRMLATAEEPTAGTISICDRPLTLDRPDPEIQRRLGFLPDDFPLYDDLNVVDYLEYFSQLYYLDEPALTQRINEVLELVSLENKRTSSIGTLSRGMKQRLSLARTIIYRPTLLLLDEPVSGLDPIARVQYRETIKTLQRQGITIFISSHILSDLEDFCTSIGIMERGRLVESSQLQALYDRDRTDKEIIIAALAKAENLQQVLQASPLVKNCEILPPTNSKSEKVCINFTGTEEEAAQLLRSLVEQGLPITEFSPVRENLEEIFLKLGYQQTS
ncbi:MAG: ABC transporter ATP-binding protein [Oscillatoriales cyanobacterium RU_3_3]|nr:ABC transporter ATP-binding protein [Microcoleus sp. SU_5_6]NJM59059.1 ABC transporter ATP-binding protein [Oscillatoriales cyanobacterium RU_3_3]NJR24569.1 ABC transporter ATP-binding protein [Richelia sp. CSU_2_1]